MQIALSWICACGVCACGFDSSGSTTELGPLAEGESSAVVDDSDDSDESSEGEPPERSTVGPHDGEDSTGEEGTVDHDPPAACVIEPEVCDGLDNDCDAAIDEWSADNAEGCGPCSAIVEEDVVYYVCTGESSWSAADRACDALGTTLVTLSDPQEHDAIVHTLESTELELVWIGLNEHTVEDRWDWPEPQDDPFFEWDGGQPDDAAGDEDCGALLVSAGKWHDTFCQNDDPAPTWRVDGWVCEGTVD